MIIDNSNLIRPLLIFNDKKPKNIEYFYVVQLIQRKKDNITKFLSNSNQRTNSNRSVYQTQIYSLEDFDNKLPILIELANVFQARIYINLNIKSSKSAFINLVKNIGCRIQTSNYLKMSRIYNEAIGECKGSALSENKWIIDIDCHDLDYITNIKNQIEQLRGSFKGHGHVFETIPTKNGFHLITSGFDTKSFRKWEQDNNLPTLDIHKDNPTILWMNTDWSINNQ